MTVRPGQPTQASGRPMTAQEAAGSSGESSTLVAATGSRMHASPHGLSHSATVTRSQSREAGRAMRVDAPRPVRVSVS